MCHLCTFNGAAIFFGAIPTYGILPYAMIGGIELDSQSHSQTELLWSGNEDSPETPDDKLLNAQNV